MAAKILTCYLAGAIRDNKPEDIEWRERIVKELEGYPIRILNPLAGKTFNPETKVWTVSGIPSSAELIVKHDFYSVDHSDIVIFNFRALSQGYPNIGTLVEFGRATKAGALIYSIVDPDYTGHGNTGMYKLHPFLSGPSAAIFPTLDDCITFLRSHVLVLAGVDPVFRPFAEHHEGLNPFYKT